MRHLETFALFCFVLFTSYLLAGATGQPDADVSDVRVLPNGVELSTHRGNVRIVAVKPNVVRVRYAPKENFPPEGSFAILPNAVPRPISVQVEQSGTSVNFTAGALRVRIMKSPLRVLFLNSAGETISEDKLDYPVSFNGSAFRVWKSMPDEEHYFGLGDKAGPLDHRNMAFTMWNTDAFGWQESTDPLYKSIPFFLAMRKGAAYGIFLDNTYRSTFEFGKESRDSYSFGADGGDLDYYFFYGPDPKQVIRDFTDLVGRAPLPPLFALGYQQCRYSYYPEARVREVAAEFRKRKIPADVIYLDIDYQQNNRPFTVDRERFPTFEKMVADLKQEGFKIVAITDLHLAKLPGYAPYDQGMKGDYFVKNPDGSVYSGKVWPGDSVFPDFTREKVRMWWGTLYTEFVNTGIRGFWNDMNEPAIFERADKTMPLDTVHSVEGRNTDHREIHNVFGMENARATYEGMLKLRPDIRPFVLTRAGFAGAQRYAATWTGDNSSTWNHMRLSVPQLINLGLSGYSFVGDDIGGFNGSPTPELLTRWMELGTFNPIFRNHGMKGSRDREPWVDGPEHEAIRRQYIETRYRLLPYIYTSLEETARTGTPLMRPMFLEFPQDETLVTIDSEFMFGSDLLVAPKVRESVGNYDVKLPNGIWYDFWSGKVVQGGTQTVDPPLGTLPVYVRGGSILPEQPLIQDTDELPQGPLQLSVYPGPNCRGALYQDDGNTMAYTRGEFLRVNFNCDSRPSTLSLHMTTAHAAYKPWWNSVKVVCFGLGQPPRDVRVNRNPVSDWKFDSASQTVTIPLQDVQPDTEVLIDK